MLWRRQCKEGMGVRALGSDLTSLLCHVGDLEKVTISFLVCLFVFHLGCLVKSSLKYLWALYSVMIIIYEATVRTVLSSVLLVSTI